VLAPAAKRPRLEWRAMAGMRLGSFWPLNPTPRGAGGKAWGGSQLRLLWLSWGIAGYMAHMGHSAATTLAERYVFDAATALPEAAQFHAPEQGPEGAFRWTGPGAEAALTILVDRRYPLRAWLELADFGHPANGDALSLFVDGDLYPLLRRGPGKNLIAGPILPRDADGPTHLIIRVPYLHSPPPTGHEARPLRGIAIKRFSLTPPD